MSDTLKEIEDFKEKAKAFTESYLSSIKEYYFLYEEEEKGAKKPNNKQVMTARKAFAAYKEKNPTATPEQLASYKDALAAHSGVEASKITDLEPEKPKNPEQEHRKLSPEERRAEDEKARQGREEFNKKQKADLEARTQNKNKPFPREHEKFKRGLPATPASKQKEIEGGISAKSEKLKAAVANYKEKHPEASAEQISTFISHLKDVINNQETSEQNRKKETAKLGMTPPTKSDVAREKLKKNFTPNSLQKRKLGSKVTSGVTSEKVVPFAKSIIQKYINAKKKMAEFGGDRPHSREDELAIYLVEKIFGMPPLDPKSEESKNAFMQATTNLYQNPTQFIPAPFLQSSLRSYPEEIANKVSSEIGSKEIHNPNFEEFMGSIKGLGPNAQKREMSKLDLGSPHDIKANRLVNYLGDMNLEDIAKLMHYFKTNENDIAVSERSYRTPEFVAGKGGFQGKTTGDLGNEESMTDVNPDIHDDSDETDKEIARQELIPDVDVSPEEEHGKFDLPSVLKHAKGGSVKELDPKYFDTLKAKNALDGYFNTFQELSDVSEDPSANREKKLEMTSKFLQNIFSDPGTQNLVIKALARQAAMSSMEQDLKNEFTEKSFDRQPPEKRHDMLKWALATYNMNQLDKRAKEKIPEIKTALAQLKHTSKDGRFTLKNPQTVVFPNENMKRAAQIVFNKLSPSQLTQLQGPAGEGSPVDNSRRRYLKFLVDIIADPQRKQSPIVQADRVEEFPSVRQPGFQPVELATVQFAAPLKLIE